DGHILRRLRGELARRLARGARWLIRVVGRLVGGGPLGGEHGLGPCRGGEGETESQRCERANHRQNPSLRPLGRLGLQYIRQPRGAVLTTMRLRRRSGASARTNLSARPGGRSAGRLSGARRPISRAVFAE